MNEVWKKPPIPLDAYMKMVGHEVGVSSWHLVDQNRINVYADVIEDHQFIHVDPEAARQTPFGQTIAHGFLTLILLPRLKTPQGYEITGFNNMLNYGSDKLRFTGAVPTGSRIHARNRVKSIERLPKGTRFTLEQNVHVVGQERPALVYELVFIYQ